MADITKFLADLGFLFTPKRASKWRFMTGVGTIRGLPSFGICHAKATDGVHCIVQHGNGQDHIEISLSNWTGDVPVSQSVAPQLNKKGPSVVKDRTEILLTQLFNDLQ